MKNTFRLFTSVLILLFCAEAISALFLPKPTAHHLPMIRFVTDPACGFHPAPNQKAYTIGSLATINKWGFRGRDWSLEKPPGVKRIAVLGSSYAFGHGVKDNDFFPAQLERFLNQKGGPVKYEVLSFGVGGFDTGHEIEVLKAHALKFHPDIVIVAFFINDIFYIKDYGFYGEMFSKLEREFNRPKWELINFFRHSRLAMFLWDWFKEGAFGRGPSEVDSAIKEYTIDGVMPPGGTKADGWLFVAQKLKEFVDISKSEGFVAQLAIIPTYQELLHPENDAPYTQYLKTTAASLNLPAISMIDVFRNDRLDLKSLIIPYDLHLSVKGHEAMAKALADTIEVNK